MCSYHLESVASHVFRPALIWHLVLANAMANGVLSIVVFQALASRLQGGDDAIYLELPELAEQQQQQQLAERNTTAGGAGNSRTRVALVPPVEPLLQLEQELEQLLVQAARRLKRLEG